MKTFRTLCAVAGLLFAVQAQAAVVTIFEAAMDAIFSQASFGSTPVDIRIGATTEFVRPDLLDITTDAEIDAVFNLHVGSQTVVNFYFVDTISACGGFNPGIIGCGEVFGQDFVVESSWAADATAPYGGTVPTGAALLSHELGHNLGLFHRDGPYLMNPFLNNFGDLNATEVATILASPLVHLDPLSGQRYIQINPVLIVATPSQVPEPATVSLMLGGLMLAGLRGRRRTSTAVA